MFDGPEHLELPEGGGPLVIGVAGGSGSGKTTISSSIVEQIGPDHVALVEHDAYYREYGSLPFEERAKVNFDHPESIDSELLGTSLVPVTGSSGVDIGVSPLRLDFGAVPAGQTRSLRVRLTNREADQLVLTSFRSDDSAFLPQAGFTTLDPMQSGDVTVTFGPAGAGAAGGVLTIGFDAPQEKVVVLPLLGEGE